MSEPINIWCDGSYRDAHGTIGVGWVQAVEGKRFHPDEHHQTLPQLQDSHNHGSDIAEFYAFAMALKSLPEGAKVQIHMDCMNAVEWLLKEEISSKSMRGKPEVAKAFAEAVAAKKRMGQVFIKLVSDRSSKNMGLAHTLSRKASTPGKRAVPKHRR
jgi:ribonuclease HI